MATLTLELKQTKLYIRYYHNATKTLLFTGLFIDPVYWDSKRKKIKSSCPEKAKSDLIINNLLQKIRGIIIDLTAANLPVDAVSVKQKFSGKSDSYTFWEYFDTYLKEASISKRKSTITNYQKLGRHLTRFEESYHCKIDFHTFNMEFYYKLKEYFFKCNYQDSYFYNTITLLKTILNDATERGYNSNYLYKSKKFVAKELSSDSVYLMEDEINSISQVSYPQKQMIEHCRDAFIIGCYTGLRYSDLKQLTMQNFQAGVIRTINIKTGSWVSIPVHPLIKKIINSRGGLPTVPDLADFNKLIKRIGKMAGVCDPVKIRKTYGGKLIIMEKLKYELLSSHTMRRSFITNLHSKGYPAKFIMQFSGHKTLKAFQKYLKEVEFSHLSIANIWGEANDQNNIPDQNYLKVTA